MIDYVFGWIIEQFHNNQVFSGLTGASLIGSATYLLRNIPQKALNIFRDQFVIYMYVNNDDYAFDCIMQWLAQLKFSRKTRRLNLATINQEDSQI